MEAALSRGPVCYANSTRKKKALELDLGTTGDPPHPASTMGKVIVGINSPKSGFCPKKYFELAV